MEKIGAYTDRATESGEWRSGNPATGQQATPMLAPYFNMLQRELVAIIQGAGIAPDKDNDGQLLEAIRRLRGGAATNFGQWRWSDNHAGSPGTGRLALDNIAPDLATTLFISETSAEAVDFIQSLGLLRAGDTITLQNRDSAGLSHRFRVTGPAVDQGAYRSIPVEYVSGQGGAPEVDAEVSVLLTQAGASDASIPLFMPQWWPNRASIPAGYAPADGQELSRATFPEAWAGVQAGNVPTVSDGTWLSTANERGKYTAGDGVSSFRLPDYNGKSVGSLGALFMRGDGALSATVAGAIQLDAMQPITGSITLDSTQSRVSSGVGALRSTTSSSFYLNNVGTSTLGDKVIEFNSAYSPTARTATETRPLNVTGCWIIKLFGSVTNPGTADAAQLTTDLAALISRVVALEARPRGLGDSQVWQNVLASRAINTTYTNTTSRPIVVSATCYWTGGHFNIGLKVGGVDVQRYIVNNSTGGSASTVTAIVPPGATYLVESSIGLSGWMELR